MTILRIVVRASVLAVVLNIVVPAVAKIFHRRRFLREVASSDAVHLTFDDGPDPRTTPQILDLLRSRGATATFFLVGERAEKNPDLVKQIWDDGHAIGSHGFSHTHPWKTAPWRSRSDIAQGDSSVRDAIPSTVEGGSGQLLFRPPYGKLNLGVLPYLSRNTAWWSVDPRDYECQSGSEVLERVRDELQPGQVVLMHDGRLGDQAGDVTVGAVREVLDYGAANGISFEALEPQPSRF